MPKLKIKTCKFSSDIVSALSLKSSFTKLNSRFIQEFSQKKIFGSQQNKVAKFNSLTGLVIGVACICMVLSVVVGCRSCFEEKEAQRYWKWGRPKWIIIHSS